jgi:hypothetical protein
MSRIGKLENHKAEAEREIPLHMPESAGKISFSHACRRRARKEKRVLDLHAIYLERGVQKRENGITRMKRQQ